MGNMQFVLPKTLPRFYLPAKRGLVQIANALTDNGTRVTCPNSRLLGHLPLELSTIGRPQSRFARSTKRSFIRRRFDKKLDAKNKQPFGFDLTRGGMMAFAGLWDAWKDPADGRWLQSYTIITTDANEIMQPIMWN